MAAEAARGLGFPFTLTARAENFLRGNPNLDDTIKRLQAFEKAEELRQRDRDAAGAQVREESDQQTVTCPRAG